MMRKTELLLLSDWTQRQRTTTLWKRFVFYVQHCELSWMNSYREETSVCYIAYRMIEASRWFPTIHSVLT